MDKMMRKTRIDEEDETEVSSEDEASLPVRAWQTNHL